MAALAILAGFPALAQAHGPTAPVASDFQARISHEPAGLDARVVDGDLRLWLRVPPTKAVTVLDYRGAPYLRFSAAGVEENVNSEMYYLNQTPVAATPPPGLTAATKPSWQRLTGGHTYIWHDGRLHALASVALAPGASYAGAWQIPLRVNARSATISGGLWHRGPPSIVWFWPIAVLLLCLLAARRLRRPELDEGLATAVSLAALAAVAVASCGHLLHGRPAVAAFNVVELALVLGLVAAAAARVLSGRAGFLFFFVIAFAALWEGITLLSTLVDGYVLMAVPPFIARTATVLCLGGGVGLLMLTFRLAEGRDGRSSRRRRPAAAAPDTQDGITQPVA